MLFRIEAVVITGVTKPTCTSRLSEWVIPSKNCDLEPGRISSMLIKKDHYKKKAIAPSKSALIETANKKRKFSTMSASQEHYLQQPDKVRSDFYEKIKNIVPRSTFAEFMQKKRLPKKPEENKTCKPSVLKIANDLRNNKENEGVKTDLLVQKLIASLDFTEEDVTALYKNTVGQSNNSEWTEQRKGRLTASKFKSIYTRAKTLEKDPKQDPSSVLSSILGYKPLKPTWQMKHGISTETHAKTSYISIMKKDRHINFTSLDPGMTAMKDYPFISVSTDLDICCDCCGKGHAEFKCPGSIKDQVPSADNLPYLELRNGETKLKTNSEYYFQVQGQMGVTGRTFLYLLSKDFIRKGYNMTVTFGQMSLKSWFGSGKNMLGQN